MGGEMDLEGVERGFLTGMINFMGTLLGIITCTQGGPHAGPALVPN